MSTLFPEEAVNEVKRQAMSELQKAVSEAERKAHEMISSERAKMERTVAEAKRQAAEDALIIINQQEDSSEVGTPNGRSNCSFALCLSVAADVFHQRRAQRGSAFVVKGMKEKNQYMQVVSRFLSLFLRNLFFPFNQESKQALEALASLICW